MLKRICVSCEYPPIIGGQGTYLKNLWGNLDASQNIILIPYQCKDHIKKNSKHNFIFMHTILGETVLRRLLRICLIFPYILINVIKYKPQELHAGQLFSTGLTALMLKFILKKKYVVYCYGADLLEYYNSILYKYIVKLILKKADLIITISKYSENLISSLYCISKHKIIIINPCVDESFFYHNENLTLQLKNQLNLTNKKIILTVGRLVERKGHDIILKALPILKEKIPNIHYLIVGDGPYYSVLLNLVYTNNLLELVTFCRNVSQKELTSYYHLSDIFVMIPRELKEKGDVEGFGIVYLEANASALPVVASNIGGIPDAVKDNYNGLLVNEPKDPLEVSEKISEILMDKTYYDRLSENALSWANKFSCEFQKKIWNDKIENRNSFFKYE